MPIKIKIFLSFLGLVAASLVFLGFKNLGVDLDLKSNQANTGSSLERDADWDDDGLNNREESYWNTDPSNPDTDGDGYLDGEEVASGHDPLKPGPDDKLPTPETLNITDKVSTLMTAGYYAGDLSANTDPEVYNQALADISAEAVIDGVQTLDPNIISSSEIRLSSNSKSDQEEYLEGLGLIVQDIWGEIVNEPRLVTENFANFYSDNDRALTRSRKYFGEKANYYREKIFEISALPVPPSWLPIHQKVLASVKTLAVNHEALSQTNEDPVKSIFAINNLVSLYQDVPPILVAIMEKIKENNLSPPNGELWSLIDALTDGL